MDEFRKKESPVINDAETKLGEASRSSGHVTHSQKRWQQPGSAQESRRRRLIWVMLSFSTLVSVSGWTVPPSVGLPVAATGERAPSLLLQI